jgi:cytochrome P460
MAAILRNPTIIDAFRAGVPGNGKPFPDRSKMAEIHWVPQPNQNAPGPPTVPGAQHDGDFMMKDGKRFADSYRAP